MAQATQTPCAARASARVRSTTASRNLLAVVFSSGTALCPFLHIGNYLTLRNTGCILAVDDIWNMNAVSGWSAGMLVSGAVRSVGADPVVSM